MVEELNVIECMEFRKTTELWDDAESTAGLAAAKRLQQSLHNTTVNYHC